ncbi:MAG: protein-tyrosine-phosphatase [Gemmatimonadetes bacterium]|nr:protein-tyrosine-phosphatase [Gemmatimonadota bacterium]
MNPAGHDSEFYPVLNRYFKARLSEFDHIPLDRGKLLDSISTYVAQRVRKDQLARLTFICTHNSRRSQMAQIWAQTAADYFAVPGVSVFSGGTEATAFNPRTLAALIRAGFWIDRGVLEENPVYTVYAGNGLASVRAFSKTYLDPSNPQDGFCAVLTCSSADRDCPVIPSADQRVLVPYEDPKSADGTDRETEVYDERCREICREMAWMFAMVSEAD